MREKMMRPRVLISGLLLVCFAVPGTSQSGRTVRMGDGPLGQFDAANLEFRQTANGGTLVLKLEVGEAAAVQLHFTDFHLGPEARVWIRGENSVAGPYRGSGPTGNGEFLSDPVTGNVVAVEMDVSGTPQASLPFRIAGAVRLDDNELALLNQPPQARLHPAEGTQGKAAFRGAIVDYEVKDGLAIFEGDIILGEPYELEPASEKSLDRQAIGLTNTSYRWPGGVVPYVIDPALPNPARITEAVIHWNTNLSGVISLVPRTTEAYYIRFVRPASAGTCSSYVGYIRRAGQAVNIGDYCSTGSVIHEIGHAVGVFHEQSREDRNSYVRILTQNIQPGTEGNFAQQIANADDIGQYDYSSIMHYSAYAFSANGQPTIETIPPGIPIGQRSGLSARDIAGVRTMYGAVAPPPPPPSPSTVTATIATNPAGKRVKVDNLDVADGTTLTWSLNSTHTLSAPDILEGRTRFKFARWSNNGPQTQSITATAAMTLIAYFTPQHEVTAASSDPARGTVTLSPASDGGFYNAGSSVTVTARPNAGWCLVSWSGVAVAPSASFNLTVNQPYQVLGTFGVGSVTVSPAYGVFPRAGGSMTFSVTSSSGCPWTTTASAPWITIGGGSGSASGTVVVTVPPNPQSGYRWAWLQTGSTTTLIYQQ